MPPTACKRSPRRPRLALASGPCLPQHASAHHGALASPQVLLALAAGAAAVELEESDDETITESALEALRSMFGSSVPPPTRTVVTRWGADKFARGSYSYVHVGASGQDYATLGEPVRASDCDRRFRARLMTSDCMLMASLIRWASDSTSRASTRSWSTRRRLWARICLGYV